jgi:hypothetical protein
LVRIPCETEGKGNVQTKTYKNKNYKYYNGLESGKQVVGPVLAQVVVEWWLGECVDKFIGVCMEANSVTGAETADFFLFD